MLIFKTTKNKWNFVLFPISRHEQQYSTHATPSFLEHKEKEDHIWKFVW